MQENQAKQQQGSFANGTDNIVSIGEVTGLGLLEHATQIVHVTNDVHFVF